MAWSSKKKTTMGSPPLTGAYWGFSLRFKVPALNLFP
jgi:hypothetical protein